MSITGKFRDTENRLLVARGCGEEGKGSDDQWVYQLSFWGDENIVKLNSDDGCSIPVNMLRTACFKGLNCVLCELSLNDAVSKNSFGSSLLPYAISTCTIIYLIFSFKATHFFLLNISFKKKSVYYSLK